MTGAINCCRQNQGKRAEERAKHPTAENINSTSQIIHRPYRTVGSLRGRFYRSTTGGFARCRLSLRRSFLAAGFDGIPGGFGGAFGGGELLG